MKPSRSVLQCAVIALSIALCWPLTTVFWFDSHEANDYVTRTVEYAAALGHGDLYPRWAPDLYGGYGSPFFNFYAPATFWLAGLFTQLLQSPTLALKLVVVLSGVLAAAFSFSLIRLETGRDEAALLGATVFVTAPYRLAEASTRGDLAELLALGALPMAMFGYRRLFHEHRGERLPWLTLQAALSHAALVVSHTLLGLWGSGILAVLIVCSGYQLWRSRQLTRVVYLGLAYAGGLLISAFYTLPALLEKKLVRTETMVVAGAAPENNPLKIATLFDPWFLGIGPMLTVALLLLLAGTAWRRRPAVLALPWLVGALLLVSLTLRWASPLWAAHVIPFGAFIQYPWRLIGPAWLCLAVGLSLCWVQLFPSRLVSGLLCLPACAAAIYLALPHSVFTPVSASTVLLSPERIASGWVRGTGLDEYLPKVVTAPSRLPALGLTQSSEALKVETVSAGTNHTLRIDASSAGKLELKLHGFPDWYAATERGPGEVALHTNALGLSTLSIPGRGSYQVRVYKGSTPTRRMAWLLSLFGLLAVWPAAALLGRRRQRPRVESLQVTTPPTEAA